MRSRVLVRFLALLALEACDTGTPDRPTVLTVGHRDSGVEDEPDASEPSSPRWSAPARLAPPADANIAYIGLNPSLYLDWKGDGIAIFWHHEAQRRGYQMTARYDARAERWLEVEQLSPDDDHTGEGLVRPAALESHSDSGTMALWAHHDGTIETLWARSFDDAAGVWSPAMAIAQGAEIGATDLARQTSGDYLATWLTIDGDNRASLHRARYDRIAGDWSAPVDFPMPGGFETVASSPSGDLFALWSEQPDDSIALSMFAQRYDLVASAWDAPVVIASAPWALGYRSATAAFDGSGNWLALLFPSDLSYSLWANRYDAQRNAWGSPVRVDSLGNVDLWPQIAVHESGRALATWSWLDIDGEGEVKDGLWASYYTPEDDAWSEPERLASDNPIDWSASLNGAGAALVAWTDWHEGDGELRSKLYLPDARDWTAPILIARQSGQLTQVAATLSDHGSALALWQREVDGQIELWTSRYR